MTLAYDATFSTSQSVLERSPINSKFCYCEVEMFRSSKASAVELVVRNKSLVATLTTDVQTVMNDTSPSGSLMDKFAFGRFHENTTCLNA